MMFYTYVFPQLGIKTDKKLLEFIKDMKFEDIKKELTPDCFIKGEENPLRMAMKVSFFLCLVMFPLIKYAVVNSRLVTICKP